MTPLIWRRLHEAGISDEQFFTLPAADIARAVGADASLFGVESRRAAIDGARAEAAFAADKGIKVLPWLSPEYPARLKACNNAPGVLYSLGDIHPMAAHVVSIVGTRHATPYGIDFTRTLVEDLVSMLDDLVIVSGLAYGIDIAAHRAALNAGVPTGAVFAHGLNMLYPSDHRKEAREMLANGGFVATEYRSNSPVHKGNFLARNRIVAGMSDVVVIVETDTKGGSLSTARHAASFQRTVVAVPGRVTDKYSRGCNALIANGEASLIRDAEDLVNVLGWQTRLKTGDQQQMLLLTPEQERIVEYLRQHPQVTANELCAALSLTYAAVSADLIELEIIDAVSAHPGGRYVAVEKAR